MATAATIATPRPNILDLDDPTTYYAQCVVDGKIVAGPHVRAACRRHLDDLRSGAERGLVWNLEQARYVIGFFTHVLCLNGGDFEGLPFLPELWQGFIIGSLFGWQWEATGYRRFNIAYIETGKGSGKSPLVAGIGLYGLVADGEQRAEIYAAATKKDQAAILFRDAVAMVDQSPELQWRVIPSGPKGKEYNLAYHDTHSFFRPISSEKSQAGPRPHISLIDEVHEHKDDTIIANQKAGQKFRKQPLMAMITNSGENLYTICGEYHDYAKKIAAGSLKNDAFFSYVCSLDQGEDPFDDESCWIKANPSLGVTIQKKYLRDQINVARGVESDRARVKRLNFCIWIGASEPLFSGEEWLAAGDDYDEASLKGRRCIGGLDLSSTKDLTALVLLFDKTADDPFYRILPYFWMPEEQLSKERDDREMVPYTEWVEQGYIQATPGKAIRKNDILHKIDGLNHQFNIDGLCFDRWRIEDLIALAEEADITLPELLEFGQGYKDMAPAIDNVEIALSNGEIKHNRHPVLTWNMSNAVARSDPAGTGDRKIDKAKARKGRKVDGTVALVMAGGKIISFEKKDNVYNKRGLVWLN